MTTLAEAAIEHARAGWEIFPLAPRSKTPAFPQVHPEGSAERQECKGRCGVDGHGLYDGTIDLDRIAGWWRRNPHYNVGGRVPAGLFVLDIDVRNDGENNLQRLIAQHGNVWNKTATSLTGGGGFHFLFRHPGGKLTEVRVAHDDDGVATGVEIKKHGGYLVLPPSIHPDTGRTYRWSEGGRPIVDAPAWLVELLRPLVAVPRQRPLVPYTGDSIIEWFNETRGWRDVLIGWTLVGGDGESDGSKWRHPSATAKQSATVRHRHLFVYSPNPGLPVTSAGDPQGLDVFKAWAHLEHGGNQSVAASAARQLKMRTAA